MNNALTLATCPLCKTGATREALERETFPYGDDHIEISALIPVVRCTACDFVFTDERAEKARHAAVCDQLGLLPPHEIRRIRTAILKMSREVLHAAYGLSAASVERWENGKLFQGETADTLIRALEDPAVARRLDRRKVRVDTEVQVEQQGQDNVVWARFPALGQDRDGAKDAMARSKAFDLRVQVK